MGFKRNRWEVWLPPHLWVVGLCNRKVVTGVGLTQKSYFGGGMEMWSN